MEIKMSAKDSREYIKTLEKKNSVLEQALAPFAKLLGHVKTEDLKGKDFFWNPSISGDEIARAREAMGSR